MTARGKKRKRSRISDSAPDEQGQADLRAPRYSLVWVSSGALLLAAVTATAYWPATGGGFVWDDDTHLTADETITDPDGLRQIWFKIGANVQYQPMIFSSFWLEYRLWGQDELGEFSARGYHVTNIVLHVIVALLSWCVLSRLRLPGAYFAAFCFAVHPVNVESVAWITERKNVLSGVFYMLALLAYLHYRGLDQDDPAVRRRLRFYAAATCFFILALLSKSVTCSLPAVLLLLIWWKRGRIDWPDLSLLASWFALGIIAALMTAHLARERVGAVGEDWALSPLESCLVAGRALWFYAAKLAWPVNLMFVYPKWDIDTGAPLQYVYPAAALAVMVALWVLRKRLGRGPVVAVWIFAGTLLPALGFFKYYFMLFSFVADHFQYLASLSLIALAAASGARFAERFDHRGRIAAMAVGGVVLCALAVLTWRQTEDYADAETLYRATLEKNPEAWLAHNNLASLLTRQGRYADAIAHYRSVLELRPDHFAALNNLGAVLWLNGKQEEAVRCFRRSLSIEPNFSKAHNNLGNALASQGKFAEAARHYRSAVATDPTNTQASRRLDEVERILRQGRNREMRPQTR